MTHKFCVFAQDKSTFNIPPHVNSYDKISTMPKWVLIIGSTSGIASALAHQYARNNHPLLLAARDCGWDMGWPREAWSPTYGLFPSDDTLSRIAGAQGVRLAGGVEEQLVTAQAGDVLLMRYRRERHPRHVVIVTERDDSRLMMIHTWRGQCVVEHGMDAVWRKRVIGVYRPLPLALAELEAEPEAGSEAELEAEVPGE